MPRPHGEQQPIEERSILGAAIGMEFECSFAAAEANKAAHQLLAQRSNLRYEDERIPNYNRNGDRVHRSPPFPQLHIIGTELDLQKTEVIDLNWHPLTAEQPVRIALLQPRRTVKREILGRTNLLRRLVKSEQEVEAGEDPILAAMFGDVALPLATFSRRKDGNCSYVQIGSEIKDDNFHVMASDDRTGRNVVIEAIRDTLNPRYVEKLLSPEHTSDPIERQRKVALEKLLAIEFRQNNEQLTTAFEAQLVRKCAERLDPETWRRLTVFDDQGERSEQCFARSVIIDKTQFSDSRIAHLMIGAPIEGDNQDIAQLFAVTRGKLAISIATLNASTGQIAFENADITPNSERRKQIVYQFLSVLRGEQLVPHGRDNRVKFTTEDSERSSAKANSKQKGVRAKLNVALAREAIGSTIGHINYQLFTKQDRAIAGFFWNPNYNRGLFAEGELPDAAGQGDYEVRTAINKFLNDPLLAQNPFPKSRVMQVAAERLSQENNVRENILNQFDVKARFANVLGATSLSEEALVEELYGLVCESTTHSGIIKNIHMNNTAADALIQVKIELDGPTYIVTVSGKPEAMNDEPLKPLPTFCFELDSARPIQPQLNGKGNSIQALRQTFRALEPVKG